LASDYYYFRGLFKKKRKKNISHILKDLPGEDGDALFTFFLPNNQLSSAKTIRVLKKILVEQLKILVIDDKAIHVGVSTSLNIDKNHLCYIVYF